ncbi:MAG: NAD-dependent DNA ligase LigA [Lachnospiraceae bacterium]|nr:NAD-dependent DNA ligase LigA [Lachnospiraceae bacterium]
MANVENGRMRELIGLLNEAARAYYAEDREIMSNFEYDRLYDELVSLEEATGIVMADSPTVKVGYESVDSLPKEEHAEPMLSLDKTKDRSVLAAFAGDRKTILSWKMDGLTIVLTYRDGKLEKGVTRGNGTVGEVITPNVRVFKNVPLTIPFTGELVLRGEAVIRYSDFEKINSSLPEGERPYKNPRNLCSGSVRQLDSSITAKRNVYFYAFSLVRAEGKDFENSHAEEFRFLASLGFDVVEYEIVDGAGISQAVDRFENKIAANDFPSDGLVALYDDIAYGASLGRTAKFPRNAFAFKWQDEIMETTLREVEWSASRTGRINPVAIFDPVELEGTTVSRASVHNVSIVKELQLGIGDRVTVYKANMIIPQIADNLTRSGTLPVPEKCPVCGGRTEIRKEISDAAAGEGVETLYCTEPDCPAKKILSFAHFVSRDALGIDGISEATLEKLIAEGLIHENADIFELSKHRAIIEKMEGFGTRSFEKMIASIESSRKTTAAKVLYGIGIPGVGVQTAKLIAAAFSDDVEAVADAGEEQLLAVDTVGPVIAEGIIKWFSKEENRKMLSRLLTFLEIEKQEEKRESSAVAGKTFVITGSLLHFSNRSELVETIERAGGKVSSSVSAKTDYLINNNTASTSGKNKKARELGIPVISEEDFLALAERN